MARIDNLSNFLNDVAVSIKEKTGIVDPILAEEFDAKIREIETGGGSVHDSSDFIFYHTESIGSVIHMTNPWQDPIGSYITFGYHPNFEFHGSPEDIGKQGILLCKWIGADECIVEQKYVFAIGGDGEVKLFETIDEMNVNPGEIGDKAIVYKEDIQNMTADSVINSVIFPETVVLPEAFMSNASLMMRPVDTSKWSDLMVDAGPSFFNAQFMGETDYFVIDYTSSDGITYTRTDSRGNPVDFGLDMYLPYPERWDDVIGYFMQIKGYRFDGLFEFNETTLQNVFSKVNYNDDTMSDVYYKIPNIINDIKYAGHTPRIIITEKELDASGLFYNIKKCKTYYGGNDLNTASIFITSDNKHYLCTDASDNTVIAHVITEYDFSLSNPIVSEHTMTKAEFDELPIFGNNTSYGSGLTRILEVLPDEYINIDLASTKVPYGIDVASASISSLQLGDDFIATRKSGYGNVKNLITSMWLIANTQFTADASDLLPGKIALSKNGEIIGDDSIYDNLDTTKLYERLYPNDKDYFGLRISTINNSDVAKIKLKQKGTALTNITSYVSDILKENIANHFNIDITTQALQRISASNETYIVIYGAVWHSNSNTTYVNIVLYNYITDSYKLFYTTFDFQTSYSTNLGARIIDKNFYIRLPKNTTYDYVKIYKFDLSTDETDITNTVVNDLVGREPFMDQISNNIIVAFDGNAIDCTTGRTYSNVKSTSGNTYGTTILYDDFKGHAIITEYERDNRRIYVRYLLKTDDSASMLTTLQMSTSLSYDGDANMYLLKLADNRYMILFKYDTAISKVIIQDGNVESEKMYTGAKIGKFTFVKLIDENTIVLSDNVVKLNDNADTYIVEEAGYFDGITSVAMIDVQKEYGMKQNNESPYLEYLLYEGLDVLVMPSLLSKQVKFGFAKNASSGPISQEEYNTAIDTANNILGGGQ